MNFKSFTQLSFSLLLFFSVCEKRSPVQPDPDNSIGKNRRIVVLYTNDEHGWMEGTGNADGAAELVGRWKQTEGYMPDSPYLILSGGDMWTGPAISTWFKDESMAEVMNKMNYSAAAIGNHEIDFKIEGLKEKIAQSTFPLLSANIREKATGDIPDFVQPYLVKEVNGVSVGIIGLTTTTTPVSTFPDYVKDYDTTRPCGNSSP